MPRDAARSTVWGDELFVIRTYYLGSFTSYLNVPENGDDGSAGCCFGHMGPTRARCA